MVVIKSFLCSLLPILGVAAFGRAQITTTTKSTTTFSTSSSTTTSKSTTIVTVTSSTTSSTTTSTTSSSTSSVASPLASGTVQATILIIARDAPTALSASSGLNGYGIPFHNLLVPQAGVTLPALNTSGVGNFAGIVIASAVSYDYGGTTGFQSALTSDQWNQLYAYQLAFGVRMVQYDVYPGPLYGSTALGGCCATGVEQLISFSNTTAFTQSGLKTGAGVTTQGLYHYPASITNTTTTTEIAQFAANANFATTSTAGVINNFGGRQQMVFFIGWATDWSPTSALLQHAWITWVTRGLYIGYRRVNLNTQIDDMFLESDIYSPAGTTFRLRPADLTAHASWTSTINAKMNPGSAYFIEIGHNGNGNIEASDDINDSTCSPGPIEYPAQIDTPLEFQKPLGSGTNLWPATPTTYSWSTACVNLDSLKTYFATASNRDKFAHISHTFTHEEVNNATYSDVYKEISFNQAWLKQVTISAGSKFTANGLIPPAITGLHNGDAISAWVALGLVHAVGDNTRPLLRNQQNDQWPYMTTMAANGYDNFTVLPRWATRIYYNCDLPNCTVAEWVATSAGTNDYNALLATEKTDTMRHLFGLYHDAYMFHQANLRQTDVPNTIVNGVSSQFSMLQTWVETQVAEFTRLVNWPIITLKQADAYTQFTARMARDQCGYGLTYTYANAKITGITVTANGNKCSALVPVTFPTNAKPTSTQGFTTEQVGNDPYTVWVKLTGSPVTFTLATPIAM